jgi:hypothetical protein
MSIGSFFTKKIGPLPVWGYGAIAAGGTFILLKGGGGGAKGKGKGKQGSGNSAGDGADGSSGNFSGSYKTDSTLSSDQTFGGGALGFLGTPFGNWGNLFVHLHPHGDGGYNMGGRRYSDHAFRSHGFGDNGRRRGRGGPTDHRHGAFGGRPFRGGGDQGGRPRGFGQGHYSPGRGVGSRIAQSFNPGNRGNRGTSWSSRTVNSDALPIGTDRGGRR